MDHNTTRMLIMAREQVLPPVNNGPVITTMIFSLRSVPAALYKALGGFATNGINLTKLESYMVGGHFSAAQFLYRCRSASGQRCFPLCHRGA